MLLHRENKENRRVVLTIQVEKDAWEKALNDAYEQSKALFKKEDGSLPTRQEMEEKHGDDVFYQDAVNSTFPVALVEAVRQEDISVAGAPELSVEAIGPEGYVFTALIDLYPEVKLGQYKGLSAVYPEVELSSDDTEAALEEYARAKAMLFPKFYINGSLGLDSVKANRFFRREAFLGSIGPSFSWPVFQGGNLVANMKAEESKMHEAALAYELAVQTAYAETRNAYSAYTQEYHRYQSLQGAVKAATDAVNISQDLYKNGLADFNNVLDAQRSLLTLEESLTISRGNITLNLIALYKALGGGIAP